MTDTSFSYKEAGVDVEAGDDASQRAANLARRTYRPEVLEIGGVALFDARFQGYKEPLLIGGSDGVGTKLKIAFAAGRHNTVGIDLVAMSVNDLIRRGGEPLVFLPYFATSKLDPNVAEQVAEGIAEGCRQANCSIIGGETAEMPDFYRKGEYDLAGTALGVVEKSRVITGANIEAGSVVLGLASSGLHSNGYSLARKALLPTYGLDDRPPELGGLSLADALLEPTRIYVKSVLSVLKAGATVEGLAHITGGGLYRKLGKIIPPGLRVHYDFSATKRAPLFDLIQNTAHISDEEMYNTFNMGIGFAVVVPMAEAENISLLFQQAGETVFKIGSVTTA
jgi:phosphoribosylformylglycinamidine cyclo-ligase